MRQVVGDVPLAGSPFPPIADYAFLSDCEVCALVAPSGNVEWMCLPRFDGPSIFGTMLDRDAGSFRLAPVDTAVPAGQRYLPGTMVLETTWGTRTGWVIVRDVLLIGPWHHGDEDLQLTLATDLRIGFEGGRARARTTLRDGDTAFIALSWSEHGGPETYDDAYHRLVFTADYWHEWLSHGEFPDHPWRTYLQRSALTLKGLTYAPTGAMVAAATTSLPETPGGERNWDYRYAWIRDSTFMLWGLYTLGFDWEANDFFYFIQDVASGEEKLQVMYGIGGERQLDEQELDHLAGYEGASPVRVGNGAYSQRQHDVWGALLDSIYLHTKSRDELPEDVWPVLERQVEMAVDRWRDPDRGIWEVRGEPQHFTSSKVFCWVACDRSARLARLREDSERATRWQAVADEIRAEVCEKGVDERGVFVQHYDTDALDASCLLLPLLRFLPPDDPRVAATVNAIADELSVDGLVRRYKVSETDGGMHG